MKGALGFGGITLGFMAAALGVVTLAVGIARRDGRIMGTGRQFVFMVLLGAVSPAAAKVRFFGEMGRIDLAAVEWSLR